MQTATLNQMIDIPTPYTGKSTPEQIDTYLHHMEQAQTVTPDTTDTPAEPAFAIDSEERANWLLRKLGNLEAEQARIKAQSAAMLKQVEGERESLMNRFGSELAQWTEEEIQRRGGKRKSLTLIQGTVAFRTVAESVKVAEDAEQLPEALALAEQWEAVETKIDRAAFLAKARAYLEETGEVAPGVVVTPAKESFSVKFPKAKGEPETE